MIIKQSHSVPEGISGVRFREYADGLFKAIKSRKGVSKAIKRGELRINGEVAETGRLIQAGMVIDHVDLMVNPPKEYRLDLEIVYEDDYMAVINKPAGIEVNGNKFKTIENALQGNVKVSEEYDALKWPRPVHRIDCPTSGLLVIAKTHRAQVSLGHQFENREIKKRYRAIVVGTPPESGTIEEPIDGRASLSEFKLVESVASLRSGTLSLVDLYPHTGRKHQLRKHMASIGHPIHGDKQHGDDGNIMKGKGLFLSSVGLSFIHPISLEKIDVEALEPQKFKTTLEREQIRWDKFNSENVEN